MATELKPGEPFGINAAALESIDFQLTVRRILTDVKSDFIYAPHLNLIYSKSSEDLISEVKGRLKSGQFSPGIPLEVEVPKSFRIPVESSKRLGPTYSRPGSILLPHDRIFFQALADKAAPIVQSAIDPERSFSHQLAEDNDSAMFQPTRKCWNDMQSKLKHHSENPDVNYVMKLDIANYFGSINQHTLINVLNDAGFPKSYSSRLESILTSYTGERSSRGILQGIFPSDLFGNFYMAPIDRMLKDYGVHSVRYVDDLYIFVESVDAAEKLLRKLIPTLRIYDLSLNESKSKIVSKSMLYTVEPDLEALFQAAVEEISSQIDGADFGSEYGFQSEWTEDEEGDEVVDDGNAGEILNLLATASLFDSIDEYPGHEENVERFCLPIFAKAESSHAVGHVMDSFKKRPAMSQIYSVYLSKFIHEEYVLEFMTDQLVDASLMDWQRMWVIAALIQRGSAKDSIVKAALDIARNGAHHDALRAVAAYFVGKFGDHGRRTELRAAYSNCSPYVQASIYASSRFWVGVERSNAKATWAGHSGLHSLLTHALKSK